MWIALSILVAAPSSPRSAEPPDLRAKSARYLADIEARHLSPEGVFLYRIRKDRIERDIALGTYPPTSDAPTFTGIFAASMCVRADADDAGRARARALAEGALDGLRALMDVTGRRGLLARSLQRTTDASGLRGEWHAGGSGYEGYVWRGDASVDQYANGLLPAVALCANAFPQRARALVTDFAVHLLENDFQLRDPDGETTRFGDLSRRSNLGFNSIAQLTAYAAISWAAELERRAVAAGGQASGRDFTAWRDRLRDRDRVVARSRTTNLDVAGITNHSNDLMAFSLYRVLVPLARETRDPALADLRHGLLRAWLRVRDQGNAYFAGIFCEVEPESCERDTLAAGRALLAQMPDDRSKRGTQPGGEEVPLRIVPGRKWTRLARDLVPMRLRPSSSFEWKSSPYRVIGDDDPNTEYTGLDFLAAYWTIERIEKRTPPTR